MLKINSIIFVNDNTGIFSLKILHFLKKQNKISSYVTVSDFILGVVKTYNLKKKKMKYKKKTKIIGIITSVKKKYTKNNGMYISFSENRCIPVKITRFINPLATQLFSPIFFEMKYMKKLKIIYAKSGAAY